jgi:hypothetical protein
VITNTLMLSIMGCFLALYFCAMIKMIFSKRKYARSLFFYILIAMGYQCLLMLPITVCVSFWF